MLLDISVGDISRLKGLDQHRQQSSFSIVTLIIICENIKVDLDLNGRGNNE
jgi:hypothetical protein